MLEYNWTDELYHYGRKGMKWYQNIFTKKRIANENRKREWYEAEKYALINDSEKITAKAPKGSTMGVTGKYDYHRKDGTLSPSYHIIDEYGDTKMSYINGVGGARAIAASKEYIDKNIDLSRHFRNIEDIDIEYGVYGDGRNPRKGSFDDALDNYSPVKNEYGYAKDLRVKGVKVGSNKNVEVAIDGDDGDNRTPASKSVMSERVAKAKNFVKDYDDSDMRESIAKDYFDDNTPWSNDPYNGGTASTKLTRDQFKNEMQLESIRVRPQNETFEAYYYDGGNSYGGHYFVAEGSMKDRKVRRISLEG